MTAPIRVYGEGSYAISAVKKIEVTEEFLGQDEDTRQCQNLETFENCMTMKYLSIVTNLCHCIPFAMKNFSTRDEVSLH